MFGAALLALGSYIPAGASTAFVGVSPAGQETVSPPGNGTMELVLSGKILFQHGRYVFYCLDTKSIFKIANPSKVRPYRGREVKIQGKLVSGTGHLYIIKIRPRT